MQTLGGVPVSLMLVAKGLRNAPLLCCWQYLKLPFVQSVSAVHRCGGSSYAPLKSASKQKPQKTRACAAVAKEVNVCVPLDRLKSTGRQPMKEPDGPGQSETSWPPGALGGG